MLCSGRLLPGAAIGRKRARVSVHRLLAAGRFMCRALLRRRGPCGFGRPAAVPDRARPASGSSSEYSEYSEYSECWMCQA